MSIFTTITGTGSFIPSEIVTNNDFLNHEFFDRDGARFIKSNESIIAKFKEITKIEERRYITQDLLLSDIAYFAAQDAISSAKIDKESLDYIIVAHNFGNLDMSCRRSEIVPCIAARVKHSLQIENPNCIAYDLAFGCPGWVQGVIQANYFIKSGEVKKALVIGGETLSRVSDPHDRDSMIYADGAGAAILEARESAEPVGIITHKTRTDSLKQAYLLKMGKSNNPQFPGDDLFLKMSGHQVHKYALKYVPRVIKETLDKAQLDLSDIKKIIIHQANEKMDEAIVKHLFSLYRIKKVTEGVMPMIISWLGNSSVATIPTLFDLIVKRKLNNHSLKKDDHIVFASVGAGMGINSIVYKMP